MTPKTAVGTKRHQRTRDSMKKRRKPLVTSIERFNAYVDKLRSLKDPQWNIAIPGKLPVDPTALQEDPDLLDDVWISTNESPESLPPRWFTDVNVRKGIKAQQKLDRCMEERERLEQEGRNLIRWFSDEFSTLKLAATLSEGK